MPPSISISTAKPARVDLLARGAHLVEHLGDERLTAETGVHAHDEQQIDVAEVRLDRVVGRLGLERETAPHTERGDLVEQRPRIAELDVHGETVGAGLRERVEQAARIVDHQVAVEKEVVCGRSAATTGGPIERFGHVVTVHAVDVQQLDVVGDARDVGREIREVGGENRRRDLHHADVHGYRERSSTRTNMPSVRAADGTSNAPRPCRRHGAPGGSSATKSGSSDAANASTASVSIRVSVHTE